MPAPPSAVYAGWCARKLVKQYCGIGLRAQLLSDSGFYRQAAAFTPQLITTIEQPAHTWASGKSCGLMPIVSITGPRSGDIVAHLKGGLDHLATNPCQALPTPTPQSSHVRLKGYIHPANIIV